jgi:hypothetical protein
MNNILSFNSGLKLDEVEKAYNDCNEGICRLDMEAVLKCKPDFLSIQGFFISALQSELLSEYMSQYNNKENTRFMISECLIHGPLEINSHNIHLIYKGNLMTNPSVTPRHELLDLE